MSKWIPVEALQPPEQMPSHRSGILYWNIDDGGLGYMGIAYQTMRGDWAPPPRSADHPKGFTHWRHTLPGPEAESLLTMPRGMFLDLTQNTYTPSPLCPTPFGCTTSVEIHPDRVVPYLDYEDPAVWGLDDEVAGHSIPNNPHVEQPTVAEDVEAILSWDCTDEIRLDDTVLFSHAYDFYGLTHLRQEAKGPNGNYLIWPSNDRWSLYRDSDGAISFERYHTEQEVKAVAELWCSHHVE